MKQLVSILLVVLILTSSVGIKVNKHFCKKEGIQYSVFSSSCTCEEPLESHSCCKNHQKPAAKDDKCCQDEDFYVVLDEDYTVNHESVVIEQLTFLGLPIFYTLFAPEFTTQEKPKNSRFKEYSPPLPDLDIPVLIQSFLI